MKVVPCAVVMSASMDDLLHASELKSALRSGVVGVELKATRLIEHRGLFLLVYTKICLQNLDRHVIYLVILVP